MKELYWIGVLQGDSRVAVVAYGANRTPKEQAGVKGKKEKRRRQFRLSCLSSLLTRRRRNTL